MNYIKLLLVTATLLTESARAQSVQHVFSEKQMTWYGLDFSQARFIGEFNQITYTNPKDAYQLRDIYFKAWNSVVLREKSKYDLAKFFRKHSVFFDTTTVASINAQVHPDSLLRPVTPTPLTRDQIQEMVQKYSSQSNTGLGLVFIVESFDKTTATGTLNVVFFDTSTRSVLLAKRCRAKAGGFGLRNYWISTAHAVMQQCRSNWRTWEKEARTN